MIFLNEKVKPISVLPGVRRKTIAQSQSMMMCEFTFDAHVEIPIHTHPNEQIGYLAIGHVRMTIAGETHELHSGDSYCAPSNIPHGVLTLEPSVIVDTFYPPREDYR